MPSGYTSKLYDGEQSFEDFARDCFSSFAGEDLSSSQYVTELDDSVTRFKSLATMSEFEIKEYCDAFNRKRQADYEALIERKEKVLARYNDMIARVERWECPKSCEKIKTLMLKQLMESAEHDCDQENVPPPGVLSPIEWFQREVSGVSEAIEFYTTQLEQWSLATQKRRAMIAEFEESIK